MTTPTNQPIPFPLGKLIQSGGYIPEDDRMDQIELRPVIDWEPTELL